MSAAERAEALYMRAASDRKRLSLILHLIQTAMASAGADGLLEEPEQTTFEHAEHLLEKEIARHAARAERLRKRWLAMIGSPEVPAGVAS